MKTCQTVVRLFALAIALACAVSPASAVTNYWADVGTDWSTTANWYNETNTINDVAAFTNATYAAQPVVGGNYNLGMLWQAGAGDVTLTGPLNTLSLYGVTNAGINYGIRMEGGAGALTISNRITVARAQTWLNDSSSLMTLRTNVALNATLTVNGTGTNRIYGVVSGAGGLTKTGTGLLEFRNTTPTFTGTLNVLGGTMVNTNTGSLNVPVNVGGAGAAAALTLFLNANYLPTYGSAKTWTVGNQGILTLGKTSAGLIAFGDNASGAQLIITNGGKLVLLSSVTDFSPTGGGTGNSGNTFKIVGGPDGNSTADWGGKTMNFGIRNHRVIIDGAGTAGGAILTNVSGFTIASKNTTLNTNNAILVINGGKLFTGIGGVDSYVVNITSAGNRASNNWVQVTGTGSLWDNNGRTIFVANTGNATATGIYNYVSIGTGGVLTNTSVTIGSGTGITSNNYLLVDGGSVFAKTVTVTRVSNYVALNAGTLSIAGKTVYSNGVDFAVGDGTQAATLVLGSANHYFQGGVVVNNNGTLLNNGTINSTGLTLNSGSTLGGTGFVASLTLPAGAVLSPGNSVGTITIPTLTMSAGSTNLIEITSPTLAPGTYDVVRSTDFVTFGGVLSLAFSGGAYTNGSVIPVYEVPSDNYDGNFEAITSTGLGPYQSALFDPATGLVTVIPEPGPVALVGGGLALLVVLRRRRK